ncbi:hypothetical protein PRNP1_000667 [Phytophthora ramorum]
METSCAVRLCIAQLHSAAVTLDAQTRRYRVAHANFSRVQVVGVCVKSNEAQLKLDDGSGLLNVEVMPNVRDGQQEIPLGALVECVGGIEEPWPPSDMTRSRRWMNATQVREMQDQNVETLRMLEVMHLYKNDYAVSHPASPAALELLAFPPIDNGNAVRNPTPNLEDNPVVIQQNTNGHQVNQCGRTSTLIEKPWEQQSVGAFHSDTGVPPADYQFALLERDHTLIEQGAKSLEIRLNVAPYSIIRVNDRITINSKTLTTVIAVRKYSRLQSILEAENVNALLPQSSFVGAGIFNASAEAGRYFRQFFSNEEEAQYGLVVFELAVSRPASTAPKSKEEWSTLVYRQLEAKRELGCSIADLRFSFPTLPAELITEILTNLQYDALVVHINGTYRLV